MLGNINKNKNRPKGLPRWQWREALKEDENKKELEEATSMKEYKAGVWSYIIFLTIAFLIFWAVYASVSGPASEVNYDAKENPIPDICDGSRNAYCP